ncbi:MAG: TonB-dependent receptor [Sulfurospirillum sp.]|nr:TonB-dependent receptor [Sulfurospirillum sp.]
MTKSILLSIATVSLLCAESTVYDLGRIEVTGTSDIGQNKTIQTVDAQTIQESESKNVVEALQTIPGVFVQQTGKKNLTDIRVRGFDNRRVPIFLDGIPVYVPYNRETDLGRYTTYDISEIIVSKGYVSPMYGANTLGGAVNIVTKKPTKEFEGQIGAGAFSGNGHEEFMTLGTNQGSYYGLLSVSNYQRDYFNLSNDYVAAGREDGGKRDNSDSKDGKINIKVGYTPNDTDEYSFNYIAQRAEKGNPYYASNYTGGDEGSRSGWRNRNWRWPEWDKTSYYFITKTAMGENTLKTRWFYDAFYNKMEDYGNLPGSFNATVPISTSEYDDHSIGGNIETNFKVSDTQMLKVSLSQKNDYHKDIASSYSGLDIKAEGITQSIGLEHSWQLGDRYTWIVGATYDKNTVKKAEYRRTVSGVTTIGEWDHYESDMVNPQTALYYKLNDQTTVYGTISKRSNMPSLSDRYSSGFGFDIPNPDLKAERSLNYEIGAEHKLSDSHILKTALFFTQTDDYIARMENVTPVAGICTSGCSQYQNIGQEEHKGFEVSVDSFWNDAVNTSLFYTYIDVDLKKSESPTAKYIVGIPEHSVGARLKYSPFKSLDIIPSLRYETERYVDNSVSTPTTKEFTLVDLKIAYRVTKELEVSAGIKNLFDEYYYYTEENQKKVLIYKQRVGNTF